MSFDLSEGGFNLDAFRGLSYPPPVAYFEAIAAKDVSAARQAMKRHIHGAASRLGIEL